MDTKFKLMFLLLDDVCPPVDKALKTIHYEVQVILTCYIFDYNTPQKYLHCSVQTFHCVSQVPFLYYKLHCDCHR